MSKVKFYKGTKQNLPTSGMVEEDALYLCTDTGELYFGISTTALLLITDAIIAKSDGVNTIVPFNNPYNNTKATGRNAIVFCENGGESTGDNIVILASGYSCSISGDMSAIIGGQGVTIGADFSAAIGTQGVTIPQGRSQVIVLGCYVDSSNITENNTVWIQNLRTIYGDYIKSSEFLLNKSGSINGNLTVNGELVASEIKTQYMQSLSSMNSLSTIAGFLESFVQYDYPYLAKGIKILGTSVSAPLVPCNSFVTMATPGSITCDLTGTTTSMQYVWSGTFVASKQCMNIDMSNGQSVVWITGNPYNLVVGNKYYFKVIGYKNGYFIGTLNLIKNTNHLISGYTLAPNETFETYFDYNMDNSVEITSDEYGYWYWDNPERYSITNLREAFWQLDCLKSVDLSNLNTSNVSNFRDMFKDANNLKYINLAGLFNTNNASTYSGMFTNVPTNCTIDYINSQFKAAIRTSNPNLKWNAV